MFTSVEGEIDEIKLAVAGLLGSMFLTNLQKKTLRGMDAAVLAGHIPSRPPYGYRKVNRIGPDGQLLRGLIEIDEDAAERVRWIMAEFAGGRSSRSIAAELNRLGVSSPTGREWNPSTIRGDPKKLTGLINNPLYAGELVWKRRQWKRNPDSERRERVPRMRDESEWVRVNVPDLRIVDEDLAAAVKAELASKALPESQSYGRSSKRPKHLLSGVIKCAKCGSSYILSGADYYRCTAYLDRKTCDNSVSVRTSVIEERVLGALQCDLLTPEIAEAFSLEFRREYERLAREAASALASASSRTDQLEREIENLAANLLSGVISATAARMLAEREQELERLKRSSETIAPKPVQFPKSEEILTRFEAKTSALRASLNDPRCREEAASTVQRLIERVIIHPEGREAEIVARSDTLLRFGSSAEIGVTLKGSKSAIQVVAGTGFEPVTFRL